MPCQHKFSRKATGFQLAFTVFTVYFQELKKKPKQQQPPQETRANFYCLLYIFINQKQQQQLPQRY